MIKKMTAPALAVLLAFASTASTVEKPVPCVSKPLKFTLDKKSNQAFAVGEKLVYALKYEFIVAGEATLETLQGPVVNCRPTIQLTSMAKSTSFMDNFFIVRDFNSSNTDKESLFSNGFHQNLREGGYRVIRNTSIDYHSGKYTYVREKKGKSTTKEGEIASPVFDVLSAFFYARTLPLELGTEYDINVFSDGETYDLKLKVYPKFEDVTVPAGKFECIKIEPKVLGDAIFKASDGKMLIWLTSDERRMPVLIRSKVAVGAFDAELKRFDTPKSDMVNEKVPT